MGGFKLVGTSIEDLYVIEPSVFGDVRGYFMETYSERVFAQAGLHMRFVQDNESSSARGVLRGLHFQTRHTQGKLVRVLQGEVFDVAVDLRRGSPSFGKWEGVVLTEQNKRMLYVPEGFAHGFLVLSERAVFSYKCTDVYAPQFEGGVRFDDPDIGIDWPLGRVGEIRLSDKDRALPYLKDQSLPFVYAGPIIKGERT